ncbi:unnamed protein product [Callosobruchus maculatus]|uniref:Endonuclease GajA/Old nuclease/RecF-like AAA domain-containing protein n=1 Tax=Callosobruchus maculatus TaxID=64391 RepID=A0A653DC65_CALMS|nr:unnamed protein product [Callosobruchus maculatus]VEN57132.1 unnamed protein product [Callosobruchus maculatus]
MSSGDEEPQPSTSRGIKRKKYLQCYKKEWELEFPGWLQASSKNLNYANCKSCNKDIKISSGKDALKKHSTSEGHLVACRSVKAQPSITSFVVKKIQKNAEMVKQGELRLAAFVAEHDLPFSIMEHLPKLIQAICPDSKIAEELKCSITKSHALVEHILGKESLNNLCQDLRQHKFSLIIDESTDRSTIKHLCLVVRAGFSRFSILTFDNTGCDKRESRKRKPFSQIPAEEPTINCKRSRDEDNNNFEKRAGTINHMILKNFMCHSLLEVKFNNNISIMIGKNGSGKSAILTALVLGLGGKATFTNRGNNVKGPMAYKPAVYGKRINIRRTLTASGSGSYKIRSENGEVVSTHAKEVQNITTGLNIQVDNPVCILNQDTSRNFLNSSDSKKKFSLFMKATRLDVLEMEYKQTNMRNLEEELKKLEKKIVNHNAMSSLKDMMKQLQIELEWAKVRDVELECEQEKSNVKTIEKKLDDFRGASNKRAEKENALNSKISELQQQIAEVKKQIEVQQRSQQEVKSKIDQIARHYNDKKKRKAQVQTSLQSKKSDIATIQKEIASHSET